MTEASEQGQPTAGRIESRAAVVSAVAHEMATRASGPPGRAASLIAAVRRRFPGYPHSPALDAWNAQQAQHDRHRLLTTRLFSDINRGHTPTPRHVSALAAATGWTFEQVSLALGVDFARIPRLHAAMGIDRTHVDEDGVAFSVARELPAELAPSVRPEVNALLNELVMDWVAADSLQWTPDDRFVAGRVGREDNLAYPRLPSGAAVLIDRSRSVPSGVTESVTPADPNGYHADADGYYAITHPNGTSCSRVHVTRDMITLLSERRDLFPALEYPLAQVRVHGRVMAFAGRIDRMRPPLGMALSRLKEEQRPVLDRARRRELAIQSLLRELMQRFGMTRSRFERKVRMLQRLAGKSFKVSRSHMSGLMENRQLQPRLNTLYALSAILQLDPLELLRAYGVPVGSAAFGSGSVYQTPELDDARDPATRIGRVRMHDTIVQLQRGGWDISWLSSLLRPGGRSQRLYYLGDPGPQLSPLITSQAFVVVNRRQRRVLTRLYDQPVADLTDWMRPIYLLHTNGPRQYLAGYVEDRGTTLDLIPHPSGPTRRVLRFKHPEEASIVGRVTHVATLVD